MTVIDISTAADGAHPERLKWHRKLPDLDYDQTVDTIKDAYTAKPPEIIYATGARVIAETHYPATLEKGELPSPEDALYATQDLAYLWDLCNSEIEWHNEGLCGSRPCDHTRDVQALIGTNNELFFHSLSAMSRMMDGAVIGSPATPEQDYNGGRRASDMTLYIDAAAPEEHGLLTFNMQIASTLKPEKMMRYDLDSVVVLVPELFFDRPGKPNNGRNKVKAVRTALNKIAIAQNSLADSIAADNLAIAEGREPQNAITENHLVQWTVEIVEALQESTGPLDELFLKYVTERPDIRELGIMLGIQDAELPQSA